MEENKEITLEQFALEEGELLVQGLTVTQLRAGILSRVDAIADGVEEDKEGDLEAAKKVVEQRR